MAKHKVKLHKWIDGVLSVVEHEFNRRYDADLFLRHNDDFHSAKILNADGSVVHEVVSQKAPKSDYA